MANLSPDCLLRSKELAHENFANCDSFYRVCLLRVGVPRTVRKRHQLPHGAGVWEGKKVRSSAKANPQATHQVRPQ